MLLLLHVSVAELYLRARMLIIVRAAARIIVMIPMPGLISVLASVLDKSTLGLKDAMLGFQVWDCHYSLSLLSIPCFFSAAVSTLTPASYGFCLSIVVIIVLLVMTHYSYFA